MCIYKCIHKHNFLTKYNTKISPLLFSCANYRLSRTNLLTFHTLLHLISVFYEDKDTVD